MICPNCQKNNDVLYLEAMRDTGEVVCIHCGETLTPARKSSLAKTVLISFITLALLIVLYWSFR